MATTVSPYSESNPHYTPQWLAEELAKSIVLTDEGTILDPACGAGNLLLAVGMTAGDPFSRPDLVGVDTSVRALSQFETLANQHLANYRVRLIHKDFLQVNNSKVRLKRPLHVIMNPPFSGYGALSKTRRESISKRLGIGGRFNLAHAFVVHAIETFHPDSLVALLPCTWARSASSRFRSRLEGLGGNWTWRELDRNPFQRVATRVGILCWRRDEGSRKECAIIADFLDEKFPDDIRVGTATGRDEVFRQLARHMEGKSVGQIVESVRGRDIGRSTSSPLWMPPTGEAGRNKAERLLPVDLLKKLGERSCVRNETRSSLEFHEKMQSWFLGEPKLILPEINSGSSIRATADLNGSLFPLHSTVAIRTKTKKRTEELKKILLTQDIFEQLRDISPRLQGTSFRLTVRSLRSLRFG